MPGLFICTKGQYTAVWTVDSLKVALLNTSLQLSHSHTLLLRQGVLSYAPKKVASEVGSETNGT